MEIPAAGVVASSGAVRFTNSNMGGLLNNLMGTSEQPQAAAGMSSLIPAAQSVPSATPDDHNGRVEYTGPQPYEFSNSQSIPGYRPEELPTPEDGRYPLPRQLQGLEGPQRAGLHDKSAPKNPNAGRPISEMSGVETQPQFSDPQMQELGKSMKADAPPDFSNIPLAQLKQIYAALAS